MRLKPDFHKRYMPLSPVENQDISRHRSSFQLGDHLMQMKHEDGQQG